MIASAWSSKKAGIALAIVFIVLLFPWVYMISCTAFTYAYWLFPVLSYASTKDVSDKESLPVPAIIHQTWKSKNIPEKWQKAQKSCIDLHPDYEYKLWTDEEGLELIEVGAPELPCLRRHRPFCYLFYLLTFLLYFLVIFR